MVIKQRIMIGNGNSGFTNFGKFKKQEYDKDKEMYKLIFSNKIIYSKMSFEEIQSFQFSNTFNSFFFPSFHLIEINGITILEAYNYQGDYKYTEQKIICEYCETEIPKNERNDEFCRYCGNKL